LLKSRARRLDSDSKRVTRVWIVVFHLASKDNRWPCPLLNSPKGGFSSLKLARLFARLRALFLGGSTNCKLNHAPGARYIELLGGTFSAVITPCVNIDWRGRSQTDVDRSWVSTNFAAPIRKGRHRDVVPVHWRCGVSFVFLTPGWITICRIPAFDCSALPDDPRFRPLPQGLYDSEMGRVTISGSPAADSPLACRGFGRKQSGQYLSQNNLTDSVRLDSGSLASSS